MFFNVSFKFQKHLFCQLMIYSKKFRIQGNIIDALPIIWVTSIVTADTTWHMPQKCIDYYYQKIAQPTLTSKKAEPNVCHLQINCKKLILASFSDMWRSWLYNLTMFCTTTKRQHGTVPITIHVLYRIQYDNLMYA